MENVICQLKFNVNLIVLARLLGAHSGKTRTMLASLALCKVQSGTLNYYGVVGLHRCIPYQQGHPTDAYALSGPIAIYVQARYDEISSIASITLSPDTLLSVPVVRVCVCIGVW